MISFAVRRRPFPWLCLLLCACAGPHRAGTVPTPDDYVILVSFDGFRHDYLDRALTPTLDSLAHAGIRARALVPVQPSKTFPSHYTIVTGLHAGEHGLVANTFFDPARGAWYSPADRTTVEDGTWYRGEPIWVTAQRQGLRTGTMFWPGSEADVAGVRPTYWKRFDDDLPDVARIDTVLSWLRLPPTVRPRLLTLYFEFTDDAGSRYGPSSPEADAAIARADSMIVRLLAGTRALPFADRINYVIVSDHGMADTRGVVSLSEYVDTTGLRSAVHGPFAFLYLDGDSARIATARVGLARMPHVRVHAPAELPETWHWDDPRVGDLVLIAEPYWQIVRAPTPLAPGAAHGWPAEEVPEMRGVLVAAGPRVEPAGVIPALHGIHVYPFLAALLGVEPAAGISGDASVLGKYLRE